MIKVCDSIMGTGKTTAAINYMNDHKDQKFIYITPYLDEAKRIKKSCPKLHFVEPSNKLQKYQFKKSLHTMALVKEGRNIATTHAAFKMYTPETLECIKKMGYTLIIDENVDTLEQFSYSADDLKLLLDAGYIEENNDNYTLKNDTYQNGALSELFKFFRTRGLTRVVNKTKESFYYWVLPSNLITSFKDVFILTYLFKGQSLYYFLKIHNLDYIDMYVDKLSTGRLVFSDSNRYIPEYLKTLKQKIHIANNDKMNDVGENFYALSINWFLKDKSNPEGLKRCISNYYNNIWRGTPIDEKLWGTYASHSSKLKAKGFTKAYLVFNAKATNKYRNRKYLVYAANPFMNAGEKILYRRYGIEADEETYALSILLQWLWRSAIRDGGDIYVYIPSRRMRTMLVEWINANDMGGESCVQKEM